MFKTMLRRGLAMLIIAAVLLTSVLSVSFFVNAADTYTVKFEKVHGRTAGDSLEGDNWLDYAVSKGNVITATGDNYSGNDAIICNRRGLQEIVFEYDAGEGYLLKSPVISYMGQAITDKRHYINVYIGAGSDPNGTWELISSIGADTAQYAVSDAYNNPQTVDVSPLAGDGMRKIYIKVSMYLYNQGNKYQTALSNLTFTAEKIEGTEDVGTAQGFITPGIGDSIELTTLGSASFTATAVPISLADRSCSVTIENPEIANLSFVGDKWVLLGESEGNTNLIIRSNGDPDFVKKVPVTVKGATTFFTDMIPIYSSDESGNIDGGKGSFASDDNSGYGPVSNFEGDYIVRRDVDFAAFGKLGASSVQAVFGWDSTKTQLAKWDIYVDSIKDENLICTLDVQPYGDTNLEKQYIFGIFDRKLTGKHDIYFVQRVAGCRIYDIAFGNYTGKYDQDIQHYFNSDLGMEYANNVVAIRGFKKIDGSMLAAKSTEIPGEIVYRVDAAPGQSLTSVLMNISARNIDGAGKGFGSVSVMISYDQFNWFSLKNVTTKIENYTMQGLDANITSINSGDLECSGYVLGQKTVYFKLGLTRGPNAQDSWQNIARVDIDVTSSDSQATVDGATDIAISASPSINWANSKSGTVTVISGDTITLNATALPATVTDKTVTVASSDPAVLAVTDKGNGQFELVAFEEGSVSVTVSTPSNVKKIVNINIESAPTTIQMVLPVNPAKNPNATIHDDGIPHPINGVATSWTGEEFGMGNTTAGDYVHFKNVDFSQFGETGPLNCYIKASNYQGETTDKVWSLYIDKKGGTDNLLATFTVTPINGWDYQQIIIKQLDRKLTGVHDLYLVCETGGSVWSLTFTDDETLGIVSYELPFSTTFESADTLWLEHVIERNGLSFAGALTATGYGKNYSKDAPVESYDDMEVNGSMILRFDAPIGSVIKDAVLEYSGRSIISPANDGNCKLPGKIEFYVTLDKDAGNWTKVAELCNDQGSFSAKLPEWLNEVDTFYMRVDVTRTGSFENWTRLNSLAVTSAAGEVNVDFVKITPEPAGLTLPFETDFTNSEWKDGLAAKSTGIGVQRSFDPQELEVSCLQATTSKNYEGVIMKFIPEEGQKIENLVIKLNGRAIGGSMLASYISTDMINWEEATMTSTAAISDDNYDAIKLFADGFDSGLDCIYVKLVFFSTGETFIDYSALTGMSVMYNTIDSVSENVPYNTVFSTGRTQINSWLRKVVELKGLTVTQSSSTISMGPVAGKSGSITMLYNLGEEAFNDLYLGLRAKSIGGSEIIISVSSDGSEYHDVAFINEHVDEYAGNANYDHEYAIADYVKGKKNVWVKITLNAVGSAGNCYINSFGITYDKAYVAPVEMPDRWQNYVFDTSMFVDGEALKPSTDTNVNTGTDTGNSGVQSDEKSPQTSDMSTPNAVAVICLLTLAVLAGCRIHLGKLYKKN